MSASVPMSPSPLKSALLGQGGAGQLPPMQAKKASMSASVPTSPSQLKSALPQVGCGGSQVLGATVENSSEKARILPLSPRALSTACSCQGPLGLRPLMTGVAPGGSRPVKGAAPAGTLLLDAVAASSRIVWQKLFPWLLVPPGWLMSVTVVPAGLVSVMTKSPTNEWSSPTVVDPWALEHELPSN